MKLRRLLLPLMLAAACTPAEQPPTEMLVVEGWIESGAAPVVMVSKSLTPSQEKQSFSAVAGNVEKWARVAISDGEKEVVMTGLPSKDHFPPYIYTTGRMFGKVGKTYTITVDTDKHHCVASTVIPEPVPLESAEPVPYGDHENEWLIKVSWFDNPDERNVYKVFSRIEGVDSLYAAARLNLVDDELISGGKAELIVTPSLNVYRKLGAEPFLSGQRVSLKFCTIDPAHVDIMKSIDESITQSGLPIFVSNRNIPGNVSGALGYFIGFGRSDYTVQIP